MLARGRFSTVRAEHEDKKKHLAGLCGHLSNYATQILRRMQPDNDTVPENVDELIEGARQTIGAMAVCVNDLERLAQQRMELKQEAWK